MASAPDLGKAYSDLLSIPFPTVDQATRRLREGDLLSIKGFGRGGAQMTARDAAVLLVALCIGHKRGGDYVAETKRVLALPPIKAIVTPDHFAHDLTIATAKNAGQAIAALICDTLVPRVREVIETGKANVILGFDRDGLFVAPSVMGPYFPQITSGAMFTYQRGERERRNIEHTTTIHGRVLLEIAMLLELPTPAPD